MSNIQFDVQGARANGYSDTQIADAIAKKAGFDAAGARQAGFNDEAIITRLTSAPRPKREPVDVDAHVAQALKKDAEAMTTRQALEMGAGKTFDMIGKGMQQAYYNVTGNEAELAALKGRVDHNKALYAPIAEAHPVATAVGESAPAMIIPVGGVGATMLGTAGKMAVAGAIPGALEYGTVEERAQKAATGAAGSVVGGVVVPKVAGMTLAASKAALKGLAGKISPEALALATRAQALGIPVNVAQLGDSKFLKTLASSLEHMPFTGGAQSAAKQRTAFTNAVGQTFGEDVNKVTPEVYAAAKSRLGKQFDELAARNELNVTDPLKAKMAAILGDAESTADDNTIRAVKNIMDRVQSQAQGSKLPGATYSSIDTQLSNIIKAGGEKGMYAKRLQETIRNGMDDSISAVDQAAWQQTRNQYKNLKAVRDIVAKDAGRGEIPPAQLMQALNSTQAGKEVMAMGKRGTLGELGQIGKQFVTDTIPNSGTVQRAMAMGLIGGGGYVSGADPTTIALMMGGGATSGRLLNKVLNSPKTLEALTRAGIPLRDLAKIPPSKLVQILGGTIGMAATQQLENE